MRSGSFCLQMSILLSHLLEKYIFYSIIIHMQYNSMHVEIYILTTYWGKLMFKRSLLSLVMILSFVTAQAAASEAPGRCAAVREFVSNCWNSAPVAFVSNMANPFAYTGAVKAMWNAGLTGALPTLYADHKPVIAGTVVLAATAVVAYHQGWFSKAKSWIESKLA